MPERKITLAEARGRGAVGLRLYCETRGRDGALCNYSAFVGDMGALIARLGAKRRLDELPYRCSKCGGRMIDARPDWGLRTPGGNAIK